MALEAHRAAVDPSRIPADPREAFADYRAQPRETDSADRPDGAVIATTTPERWKGELVRVLDLTP
ncbi:hypothetical protein [Streptomyces cinereoruber]|uniref:hypothetical protein n=1 Tax=Streptomyces cinereoruber TaxID=67260 RepID=UPI003C2FBC56